MTKKEFAEIAAFLAGAYPAANIGEATVTIYYENLKDLDFSALAQAAKAAVQVGKFYPSIAELRERYVEVAYPDTRIDQTGAIGILNNAISKFGRYRQAEAMEYIRKESEALYEVVKAIRFGDICNADMNRYRGEIETLYREAARNLKEVSQLTGETRNNIARLRGKIRANALALESDSYV